MSKAPLSCPLFIRSLGACDNVAQFMSSVQPGSAAPSHARALPHLQVRVAVIGNVDSGKSTMVGVLTRSMLDDGRGAARSKVSWLQRRPMLAGLEQGSRRLCGVNHEGLRLRCGLLHVLLC